MIQIKCTRKLLKRLSQKPIEPVPQARPVLGDWFSDIIPVMGGEIIICLNELSMLTVVLPVSSSIQFREGLIQRIVLLLERISVPPVYVKAAKSEFDPIQFTKTDSRKMLGHLRDITEYCQAATDFRPPDRIKNQMYMEDNLSERLYGPAPYRYPLDLLTEAINEWHVRNNI